MALKFLNVIKQKLKKQIKNGLQIFIQLFSMQKNSIIRAKTKKKDKKVQITILRHGEITLQFQDLIKTKTLKEKKALGYSYNYSAYKNIDLLVQKQKRQT